MSTVVEIEHAIESLAADQYAELLAWIDEHRSAQVDAQFEAAVLSGKFDALARQAERTIEAGESVPLDDFLRERH